MASTNLAEFHDLCRICGNKTSVLMGLHIFEREAELRQISKKITECLPIKIQNTDKLPKMVCEECVYKLDLLYDFRENSLKTDVVLNNVLKEIFSNPNSDKVQLLETSVIPSSVLPGNIDKQSDSKLDIVAAVASSTDVAAADSLLNASTTATLIISNVHSLHSNLKAEPDILIKVEEIAASGMIDASSNVIENQSCVVSETPSDLDSVSCCDSDDFTNAINTSGSNLQENEESRDVPVADVKQPEKVAPEPDTFSGNGEFLVQMHQESEEQSTTWFFCNICGKTFSNKDEFNVHYEVHWNKCHLCGAVFTDEEALGTHCKEVHSNKAQVNCIEAVSSMKNEVQVEKSLFEKGSNKAVEDGSKKTAEIGSKACPECGKMYRTNYKLNEHMRIHTGEKPYKCSTCDKAFRSKIGLAQHEAQHTGHYDYTCDLCGKGFQCKSYLAVHQRVHSDAKPYTCSTCSRHFKTKQSLLDHENRHLGVKPYLCETCGRGFITKGLCKSHQRVHSGSDNRRHPCLVCHKLFVSKSYLATHARIHTGEKPFMCEVCGKGFLTRVDLRIHSTVHTGEKSFVCEVCGKAFARRDALRCHRRSHTGERPYRCDVCGQSFTQFSPMAIHRRLHTGERPYACDICAATFVSRSTMLAHRKKHAVC